MTYDSLTKEQLISALKKRDAQIRKLQEFKNQVYDQTNKNALTEREEKLKESQRVAKVGHYSFDVLSGLWTNSEQLDVIFELDESFVRDVEGWLSLVHPDYIEEMKSHLMVDVLQNKKQFNKEYKTITYKTHQEKWIHGLGDLELNDEGEPVEMFGTLQDITERKNIEEALHERENKLNESQKVAKLGHYSFNILTGLWTNSEQLDKIFEIDKNFKRDVAGWLGLIHPKFIEEMQNHLLIDVIQNGNQFNKEYKIISLKTKQEKWIHGLGNLKFNEKNEPIEMFGTIQDITERKIIEQAQIESEAKLQKLFDKSLHAIFVIEIKTGKFIDANKAAEEITGYSFEEIFSMTANDFTAITKARKSIDPVKVLLIEETTDLGEIIFAHKDGSKRVANLSIIPINEKYMYGIATDLTERKKIEQEIIDAKNKALASDKMKSEFLAQMSHEIRSPINVIVNFLSLIREETNALNNEIIDSSFSSIDSSTKRIIRTIDLILNMSDLQLGTYSVSLAEIKLTDLLKYLYDEYKTVAKNKNLELKLNINVSDDKVITDDYALKQIVANLIDNAIKYTAHGFIEVRLKEIKDNFIIEIEDSGMGISENFIPEIFSAFSQESKGYTRQFDGTGLGLSLVKKYCQLINATISVQSKKNVGSTFTLTFPNK